MNIFIILLFLLFTCQIIRLGSSNRSTRINESDKIKAVSFLDGKGEPSKTGPSEGEAYKEVPGSSKEVPCLQYISGKVSVHNEITPNTGYSLIGLIF